MLVYQDTTSYIRAKTQYIVRLRLQEMDERQRLNPKMISRLTKKLYITFHHW